MFFHFILLVVSLMGFLRGVFDCDENCAEKPVFSPSRLVLMFGDPSSTTCTVCEKCTNEFGFENSVGNNTVNGTTITWQAGSVTEWDLPLMCYYEDVQQNDTQCCTRLLVTVYKPPENVSIRFVDHTGPMYEGRQYTLQCTVQDVAPVENLTVTFYREHTILGQLQSNKTTRKPVAEIFPLNITLSKEDDGLQYWCEAKLELGPGGPQSPPVVKSQNITATVYYKPRLVRPPPPYQITITEGESLLLDCSSVGNPSPSYAWTGPSDTPSPSGNNSMLFFKSATPADGGNYTCSVSNHLATLTMTSTVVVKDRMLPSTRLPSTTTQATTTASSKSTSSILIHRFIMCCMLLFSALV